MDLKELGIEPGKLPAHIAIVMDGNGRWAKERGLSRIFGHKAGVEAVREVVRACAEIGISYLTLYTFSIENWQRPRDEVSALMVMLKGLLVSELPELNEKGVRILALGRTSDLPKSVQKELKEALEVTSANQGLKLILALSYGGRDEIVEAARRIGGALERKELSPEDLDEETFRKYLYRPEMPDPDLLIRTSGEFRVSNFLLWQIAYSEIWVTKTLWPDFGRADLLEAIRDYQKRERRFGRVNE